MITIDGLELPYPESKTTLAQAGKILQFIRIGGTREYECLAREALAKGKSYMPNTYLDLLRPQFSISNSHSPMLAYYMRAKHPDLAAAFAPAHDKESISGRPEMLYTAYTLSNYLINVMQR